MDFSKIHFTDIAGIKRGLAEIRSRRLVVLLERQRAVEWNLAEFMKDLSEKGGAIWIDQAQTLPTQKTVWYACRQISCFSEIGGIVAIGGGSAIDLAKALSAFHGMDFEEPEDLIDAIASKEYLNNNIGSLPIIAVPTTAGTGSEVTHWATVWDEAKPKKYSIDAPRLLPDEVWIAPELTLTLPPKLTLSTGLDAVCHAAEAYWAKASNFLAKELSIRSLQIITENLNRVLQNSEDYISRCNMATGALLAGLAFSQTRTTACHSISYPITSLYGVEHGLACALTLDGVARINAEAVRLSPLLEVFQPLGGIQQWLDDTCGDMVNLSLSGLGIPEDAIPIITANAFSEGRMDNNPVKLTPEVVQQLLFDRA
jgi:alcohol dehydrogenase class IV